MFADTILGMGRTSIFESAIDDEIEAVTPDTVDECAGDPFEFLTGAYYESELNMMNINQAVMVCEYTYLKENGTEMIYEANVITSMFSKIGSKIKQAWQKICEFFKSIFSWLESTVRNDKKFVDKYKDKIKKISSVTISEFKGYTYGGSGDAVSKKADKMYSAVKTQVNGSEILEISNKDNIADAMDEFRGKLVGGSGKVEAGKLAEELGKAFRGDEWKVTTLSQSQLSDMLDTISSTKVTKAHLNKLYTECKGTVDSLLKTAKAAEKEAAAGSTAADDQKAKLAKSWHNRASVLNSMTSIVTMVNNKAVKAVTAQNRQCCALVKKAVAKAGKSTDDEKKATGESASFVDQVFESFLG